MGHIADQNDPFCLTGNCTFEDICRKVFDYKTVRDAHAKFAYFEKNIVWSKIIEFWEGLCKVNSEFLIIGLFEVACYDDSLFKS